jgi:hypothetical protein
MMKMTRVQKMRQNMDLEKDTNGCLEVQVKETMLFVVDREENKNTLRVVVASEVPSRGMKRIHESDNSNSDKDLTHH